MIGRITTFAFEARPIDVEVQLYGGANAFCIVGMPDKAVGAKALAAKAAGLMSRSARADNHVLKGARAIADLDRSHSVARVHAAASLTCRFRPALAGRAGASGMRGILA